MRTQSAIAGLLVAGCLTACFPHPRQLALITPKLPPFSATPDAPVAGSNALYYTRSEANQRFQAVLCFAPPRFEVVQGAAGSLVWLRSAAGKFEMEFILRVALADEELTALRSEVPGGIAPPVLLVPCGIEIVNVSPLAQFPVGVETAFWQGKSPDNTDILVVRITSSSSRRRRLLEMVQSAVGIALTITYQVRGTMDERPAIGYLRSSTSTVR